MTKKTMKYQARRPMPRIRTTTRRRTARSTLTLGDLIAAAYDACGDTRSVTRVLGSHAMAERLGVHLVIG